MVQISIELPHEIFSALRTDPEGFVREMRIAAAVKWYETGVVSQSKGAEIAGISRTEFMNALDPKRSLRGGFPWRNLSRAEGERGQAVWGVPDETSSAGGVG